jgi:hypothetical protein
MLQAALAKDFKASLLKAFAVKAFTVYAPNYKLQIPNYHFPQILIPCGLQRFFTKK